MFYIRTDANEKIAMGHVMRCFTIAQEIKRRGEEVTFITADTSIQELIISKGFLILCLNTKWNDMEGELDIIIKLINQYIIKKLLIDSYSVTDKYLETISNYTKVIYMDDLGEIRYPVHTIINYNIYADKFDYQNQFNTSYTKILTGCTYTPLRAEFQNIQPIFRENVSNVLITTGGSDPFHVAVNTLKTLNTTDMKSIRFHVIAGRYHQDLLELEQLASQFNNITIYQNVEKMSDLMLLCDIAVTAGGSTMYELCACGVCMITFSFADNQLEGVKEFQEKNMAFYAGDARRETQSLYDTIYQYFSLLINKPTKRKEFFERTTNSVNKLGVVHLVNEIL